MNEQSKGSSNTSVVQHIENETFPYRLPVWKLSKQKIKFSNNDQIEAHTIRIRSCDFNTNYYNIAFNNNAIRWLRRVRLEINDTVAEQFPNNVNAVNPYFTTAPKDEWHLCTLYITPSQYKTADDIISEMNVRFEDSFKNLFEMEQKSLPSQENIVYDASNIYNRNGMFKLEDTQIKNAEVNTFNDYPASYCVEGDFVCTNLETNETKYYNNCILDCKGFERINISEATIVNPKFSGSKVNIYNNDGIKYAYNVGISNSSHEGNIAIIPETKVVKTNTTVGLQHSNLKAISDKVSFGGSKVKSVLNAARSFDPSEIIMTYNEPQTFIPTRLRNRFTARSVDNNTNEPNSHVVNIPTLYSPTDYEILNPLSIDGPELTINKAVLKSFPDYIGLTNYPNRFKFSDNEFHYTPTLNTDLKIDFNLQLKPDNDGEYSFATVTNGTIGIKSTNVGALETTETDIPEQRKHTSLINYFGWIKDDELLPRTKIFYNDNARLSQQYPYFHIHEQVTSQIAHRHNIYYHTEQISGSKNYKDKIDFIKTSTSNKNVDIWFDIGNAIADTSSFNPKYNEWIYRYNIKSGVLNEFILERIHCSPKICGYKIHAIEVNDVENGFTLNKVTINPIASPKIQIGEEFAGRLTQMNIAPVINDLKSSIIITPIVNITQTDKHGFNVVNYNEDMTFNKDGMYYSDGKLATYYISFPVSQEFPIIVNNISDNTYVTILRSTIYVRVNDDKNNPIYSELIINGKGDNSLSKEQYSIMTNSHKINVQSMKVIVKEGSAVLYTLTVNAKDCIPCDTEGNIEKLYYTYDNELKKLIDTNVEIPNMDKCYANGAADKEYILISLYNDDKYDSILDINNSIDSNNVNNNIASISGLNIYREREQDLYTNTIVPVESSKFTLNNVYDSYFKDMLYLPFGTFKKIGSIVTNSSSNPHIDDTYLFNDIVDTNVLFKLSRATIRPLTKLVMKSVSEVTTYHAVDKYSFGHKYFVMNIDNEPIEITNMYSAQLGFINIDSNTYNNLFGDTLTKYYVKNINHRRLTTQAEVNNVQVKYYLYDGEYVYVSEYNKYSLVDEYLAKHTGGLLAFHKSAIDNENTKCNYYIEYAPMIDTDDDGVLDSQPQAGNGDLVYVANFETIIDSNLEQLIKTFFVKPDTQNESIYLPFNKTAIYIGNRVFVKSNVVDNSKYYLNYSDPNDLTHDINYSPVVDENMYLKTVTETDLVADINDDNENIDICTTAITNVINKTTGETISIDKQVKVNIVDDKIYINDVQIELHLQNNDVYSLNTKLFSEFYISKVNPADNVYIYDDKLVKLQLHGSKTIVTWQQLQSLITNDESTSINSITLNYDRSNDCLKITSQVNGVNDLLLDMLMLVPNNDYRTTNPNVTFYNNKVNNDKPVELFINFVKFNPKTDVRVRYSNVIYHLNQYTNYSFNYGIQKYNFPIDSVERYDVKYKFTPTNTNEVSYTLTSDNNDLCDWRKVEFKANEWAFMKFDRTTKYIRSIDVNTSINDKNVWVCETELSYQFIKAFNNANINVGSGYITHEFVLLHRIDEVTDDDQFVFELLDKTKVVIVTESTLTNQLKPDDCILMHYGSLSNYRGQKPTTTLAADDFVYVDQSGQSVITKLKRIDNEQTLKSKDLLKSFVQTMIQDNEAEILTMDKRANTYSDNLMIAYYYGNVVTGESFSGHCKRIWIDLVDNVTMETIYVDLNKNYDNLIALQPDEPTVGDEVQAVGDVLDNEIVGDELTIITHPDDQTHSDVPAMRTEIQVPKVSYRNRTGDHLTSLFIVSIDSNFSNFVVSNSKHSVLTTYYKSKTTTNTIDNYLTFTTEIEPRPFTTSIKNNLPIHERDQVYIYKPTLTYINHPWWMKTEYFVKNSAGNYFGSKVHKFEFEIDIRNKVSNMFGYTYIGVPSDLSNMDEQYKYLYLTLSEMKQILYPVMNNIEEPLESYYLVPIDNNLTKISGSKYQVSYEMVCYFQPIMISRMLNTFTKQLKPTDIEQLYIKQTEYKYVALKDIQMYEYTGTRSFKNITNRGILNYNPNYRYYLKHDTEDLFVRINDEDFFVNLVWYIKNQVYAKTTNGQFVYVNNRYVPVNEVVRSDNVYEKVLEYEIWRQGIDANVKYIAVNNTPPTYKYVDGQKIEVTKVVLKYYPEQIYEDRIETISNDKTLTVDKYYVTPINIEGYSSATGYKYQFGVNTILQTNNTLNEIFGENNINLVIDQSQHQLNNQFILNAVSLKDRLLFRPDGMPTLLSLTGETSANISVVLVSYLKSTDYAYQINKAVMIETDVYDNSIMYENNEVKCMKISTDTFTESSNVENKIFNNVGTIMKAEDIYFDHDDNIIALSNTASVVGPSSEGAVIFDITNIEKNKSTAINSSVDGIRYNIYSGTFDGVDRNYTYIPHESDFNGNSSKIVEYVDSSLAKFNGKNYLHSYYDKNSSKYIYPNNFINPEHDTLINAFEYKFTDTDSINNIVNKLTSLQAKDNVLIVPTSGDISYFDREYFNNKSAAPTFYKSSVKINNKRIKYRDSNSTLHDSIPQKDGFYYAVTDLDGYTSYYPPVPTTKTVTAIKNTYLHVLSQELTFVKPAPSKNEPQIKLIERNDENVVVSETYLPELPGIGTIVNGQKVTQQTIDNLKSTAIEYEHITEEIQTVVEMSQQEIRDIMDSAEKITEVEIEIPENVDVIARKFIRTDVNSDVLRSVKAKDLNLNQKSKIQDQKHSEMTSEQRSAAKEYHLNKLTESDKNNIVNSYVKTLTSAVIDQHLSGYINYLDVKSPTSPIFTTVDGNIIHNCRYEFYKTHFASAIKKLSLSQDIIAAYSKFHNRNLDYSAQNDSFFSQSFPSSYSSDEQYQLRYNTLISLYYYFTASLTQNDRFDIYVEYIRANMTVNDNLFTVLEPLGYINKPDSDLDGTEQDTNRRILIEYVNNLTDNGFTIRHKFRALYWKFGGSKLTDEIKTAAERFYATIDKSRLNELMIGDRVINDENNNTTDKYKIIFPVIPASLGDADGYIRMLVSSSIARMNADYKTSLPDAERIKVLTEYYWNGNDSLKSSIQNYYWYSLSGTEIKKIELVYLATIYNNDDSFYQSYLDDLYNTSLEQLSEFLEPQTKDKLFKSYLHDGLVMNDKVNLNYNCSIIVVESESKTIDGKLIYEADNTATNQNNITISNSLYSAVGGWTITNPNKVRLIVDNTVNDGTFIIEISDETYTFARREINLPIITETKGFVVYVFNTMNINATTTTDSMIDVVSGYQEKTVSVKNGETIKSDPNNYAHRITTNENGMYKNYKIVSNYNYNYREPIYEFTNNCIYNKITGYIYRSTYMLKTNDVLTDTLLEITNTDSNSVSQEPLCRIDIKYITISNANRNINLDANGNITQMNKDYRSTFGTSMWDVTITPIKGNKTVTLEYNINNNELYLDPELTKPATFGKYIRINNKIYNIFDSEVVKLVMNYTDGGLNFEDKNTSINKIYKQSFAIDNTKGSYVNNNNCYELVNENKHSIGGYTEGQLIMTNVSSFIANEPLKAKRMISNTSKQIYKHRYVKTINTNNFESDTNSVGTIRRGTFDKNNYAFMIVPVNDINNNYVDNKGYKIMYRNTDNYNNFCSEEQLCNLSSTNANILQNEMIMYRPISRELMVINGDKHRNVYNDDSIYDNQDFRIDEFIEKVKQYYLNDDETNVCDHLLVMKLKQRDENGNVFVDPKLIPQNDFEISYDIIANVRSETHNQNVEWKILPETTITKFKVVDNSLTSQSLQDYAINFNSLSPMHDKIDLYKVRFFTFDDTGKQYCLFYREQDTDGQVTYKYIPDQDISDNTVDGRLKIRPVKVDGSERYNRMALMDKYNNEILGIVEDVKILANGQFVNGGKIDEMINFISTNEPNIMKYDKEINDAIDLCTRAIEKIENDKKQADETALDKKNLAIQNANNKYNSDEQSLTATFNGAIVTTSLTWPESNYEAIKAQALTNYNNEVQLHLQTYNIEEQAAKTTQNTKDGQANTVFDNAESEAIRIYNVICDAADEKQTNDDAEAKRIYDNELADALKTYNDTCAAALKTEQDNEPNLDIMLNQQLLKVEREFVNEPFKGIVIDSHITTNHSAEINTYATGIKANYNKYIDDCFEIIQNQRSVDDIIAYEKQLQLNHDKYIKTCYNNVSKSDQTTYTNAIELNKTTFDNGLKELMTTEKAKNNSSKLSYYSLIDEHLTTYANELLKLIPDSKASKTNYNKSIENNNSTYESSLVTLLTSEKTKESQYKTKYDNMINEITTKLSRINEQINVRLDGHIKHYINNNETLPVESDIKQHIMNICQQIYENESNIDSIIPIADDIIINQSLPDVEPDVELNPIISFDKVKQIFIDGKSEWTITKTNELKLPININFENEIKNSESYISGKCQLFVTKYNSNVTDLDTLIADNHSCLYNPKVRDVDLTNELLKTEVKTAAETRQTADNESLEIYETEIKSRESYKTKINELTVTKNTADNNAYETLITNVKANKSEAEQQASQTEIEENILAKELLISKYLIEQPSLFVKANSDKTTADAGSLTNLQSCLDGCENCNIETLIQSIDEVIKNIEINATTNRDNILKQRTNYVATEQTANETKTTAETTAKTKYDNTVKNNQTACTNAKTKAESDKTKVINDATNDKTKAEKDNLNEYNTENAAALDRQTKADKDSLSLKESIETACDTHKTNLETATSTRDNSISVANSTYDTDLQNNINKYNEDTAVAIQTRDDSKAATTVKCGEIDPYAILLVKSAQPTVLSTINNPHPEGLFICQEPNRQRYLCYCFIKNNLCQIVETFDIAFNTAGYMQITFEHNNYFVNSENNLTWISQIGYYMITDDYSARPYSLMSYKFRFIHKKACTLNSSNVDYYICNHGSTTPLTSIPNVYENKQLNFIFNTTTQQFNFENNGYDLYEISSNTNIKPLHNITLTMNYIRGTYQFEHIGLHNRCYNYCGIYDNIQLEPEIDIHYLNGKVNDFTISTDKLFDGLTTYKQPQTLITTVADVNYELPENNSHIDTESFVVISPTSPTRAKYLDINRFNILPDSTETITVHYHSTDPLKPFNIPVFKLNRLDRCMVLTNQNLFNNDYITYANPNLEYIAGESTRMFNKFNAKSFSTTLPEVRDVEELSKFSFFYEYKPGVVPNDVNNTKDRRVHKYDLMQCYLLIPFTKYDVRQNENVYYNTTTHDICYYDVLDTYNTLTTDGLTGDKYNIINDVINNNGISDIKIDYDTQKVSITINENEYTFRIDDVRMINSDIWSEQVITYHETAVPISSDEPSQPDQPLKFSVPNVSGFSEYENRTYRKIYKSFKAGVEHYRNMFENNRIIYNPAATTTVARSTTYEDEFGTYILRQLKDPTINMSSNITYSNIFSVHTSHFALSKTFKVDLPAYSYAECQNALKYARITSMDQSYDYLYIYNSENKRVNLTHFDIFINIPHSVYIYNNVDYIATDNLYTLSYRQTTSGNYYRFVRDGELYYYPLDKCQLKLNFDRNNYLMPYNNDSIKYTFTPSANVVINTDKYVEFTNANPTRMLNDNVVMNYTHIGLKAIFLFGSSASTEILNICKLRIINQYFDDDNLLKQYLMTNYHATKCNQISLYRECTNYIKLFSINDDITFDRINDISNVKDKIFPLVYNEDDGKYYINERYQQCHYKPDQKYHISNILVGMNQEFNELANDKTFSTITGNNKFIQSTTTGNLNSLTLTSIDNPLNVKSLMILSNANNKKVGVSFTSNANYQYTNYYIMNTIDVEGFNMDRWFKSETFNIDVAAENIFNSDEVDKYKKLILGECYDNIQQYYTNVGSRTFNVVDKVFDVNPDYNDTKYQINKLPTLNPRRFVYSIYGDSVIDGITGGRAKLIGSVYDNSNGDKLMNYIRDIQFDEQFNDEQSITNMSVMTFNNERSILNQPMTFNNERSILNQPMTFASDSSVMTNNSRSIANVEPQITVLSVHSLPAETNTKITNYRSPTARESLSLLNPLEYINSLIDSVNSITLKANTRMKRSLFADDESLFGLRDCHTRINKYQHNVNIFPTDFNKCYQSNVISVTTDAITGLETTNIDTTNNLSFNIAAVQGIHMLSQNVSKERAVDAEPTQNEAKISTVINELPNTYKLKIRNYNESESDKFIINYNGNEFVFECDNVQTIVDNINNTSTKMSLDINLSTANYQPVFYTFMSNMCVASGDLQSGRLSDVTAKSLDKLVDDKNVQETVYKYSKIQSNYELLYDNYYETIRNNIISNKQNFVKTDMYGSPNIGVQFGFDCIPVSSDLVRSRTLDFLNVVQDVNFNNNSDTFKLENVIDYQKGEFKLVSNTYNLNKYEEYKSYVDDYYYNFTIDDDIWKKLGFNPCRIDYDKVFRYARNVSDLSNVSNIEPVYFIKGKYYSEELYTGPLTVPNPVHISERKELSKNKFVMTKNIIKPTDNVLALDQTFVNKYFHKQLHYAERMINLSLPSTIDIHITQNEDVEKVVNDANRFVDSSGLIGSYNVIRPNEPVYTNIQQSIDINQTITVTDKGEMYIYLSSPNQRYPIINSDAMLHIEYIK